MESIEHRIRREGWFLRRRDLLMAGYNDAMLRSALARKRIFRVPAAQTHQPIQTIGCRRRHRAVLARPPAP